MTTVVRAVLAWAIVAGATSATVDDDDRARIEAWLEAGAFARADSLAMTLRAAAPESSITWIDARQLEMRTARRSGRIRNALLVRFCEHLIEVQKAVLAEDDPRIAEAFHTLANTHVRGGDQTAAAVAFREAWTRRRASLGDDATATIRSALGLANALQWTGARDEARRIFDAQIARLEANPTGREDRLVFALNGLGFLLRRAGERDAAIGAFRRAVVIADASMPDVHLTRALVERNLGNTLAEPAPELAIDHLRRAFVIRRELLPPRDLLVGSVAMELAEVEARLGRTSSADAHFAIAIDILGSRKNRQRTVSRAWVGRANAAIARSDFDGAVTAIDSAAARGADETTLLALRANRANEMGDFAVAVDLYDQALRRREATDGRRSSAFARLLHNRAEVLHRQGRTNAALGAWREAVAIQEEVLDPDDPVLALGRLNLAIGSVEAGDEQTAVGLLPAIESAVATFDSTHPAHANLRLLQARAAAAGGDTDQAVRRANEAVTLRRIAFGPDHIEVAWALDELAGHALAGDDPSRAATPARRADTIARAFFRDALLTLPERQSLAFVDEGRTGRDRLLEAARRDPMYVGRAFDATVRGRALVLDALLERRAATATATDDTLVVAARERLDRARRDLVAAATRGEVDATRWRRLQERRDRAESALARVSAEERRRQERAARGGETIVDAVAPDEALVSFVVTREPARVLAFVVRDARVDLVDLGAAAAVEVRVARWLEAVRAPITRFDDDPEDLAREVRAASRDLGALVFDPLEESIAGATRLWWIPDGALHRVQPAALVDRAGQYLATRDLVFAHLTAARDLTESTSSRASRRVLAVGDPDFGPSTATSTPCPDLESLRFAPLPATRDEVRSVPGATLVLGADAREDDLPALADGHDTLHLATHGFFLPATCAPTAESSLRGLRGIGGVARRQGRTTARTAVVDPLLRSGLAFAGANTRAGEDDPSRDGLLLAEEIAGLQLRGVDTVVLSACDTGVGRIVEGEGVLGLPRAFRQAGARQIVMSLWPVQDDATRRWMSAFYTARSDGADVARAAHTARRAMLATDATLHPFFWAAFVAIGPER